MEKSYAPRVFSGRNKTDVERHERMGERGDESILAPHAYPSFALPSTYDSKNAALFRSLSPLVGERESIRSAPRWSPQSVPILNSAKLRRGVITRNSARLVS